MKRKISDLEEENSNAIQETESLIKAKKDLESQIEKLEGYQKELLKINTEAEALRAEHDNMRHTKTRAPGETQQCSSEKGLLARGHCKSDIENDGT
jgi:DNA repair exonuclease SbcCD ATPase subunit